MRPRRHGLRLFLTFVVLAAGAPLQATGTGKLVVTWLELAAHGLAVVVVSALPDHPSNATTPYPCSPGTHATKVFGALGAKVYVTAWHGHVQVVSDSATVKTSVQRESEPWPEPPKPAVK